MDWHLILYPAGDSWGYRVECGPERVVVGIGISDTREQALRNLWAAWKFIRDKRRGHGRPAHARA